MALEDFGNGGYVGSEIRNLDDFLIRLFVVGEEFTEFKNTLIPWLDKNEIESFTHYASTLANAGVATVMIIGMLRNIQRRL